MQVLARTAHGQVSVRDREVDENIVAPDSEGGEVEPGSSCKSVFGSEKSSETRITSSHAEQLEIVLGAQAVPGVEDGGPTEADQKGGHGEEEEGLVGLQIVARR